MNSASSKFLSRYNATVSHFFIATYSKKFLGHAFAGPEVYVYPRNHVKPDVIPSLLAHQYLPTHSAHVLTPQVAPFVMRPYLHSSIEALIPNISEYSYRTFSCGACNY